MLGVWEICFLSLAKVKEKKRVRPATTDKLIKGLEPKTAIQVRNMGNSNGNVWLLAAYPLQETLEIWGPEGEIR